MFQNILQGTTDSSLLTEPNGFFFVVPRELLIGVHFRHYYGKIYRLVVEIASWTSVD
jgi:hypothetical protein